MKRDISWISFAVGALSTLIIIALAVILSGCSIEFEEKTIVYDGEERPISEVEDIIGDTLEVENPGKDIDVDIYEEADE